MIDDDDLIEVRSTYEQPHPLNGWDWVLAVVYPAIGWLFIC